MAVALTQVITEDRASGAQVIDGSLKFDGSSYLTRTPSSAGNRRTSTFSMWFKPTTTSGEGVFFNATGYTKIAIDSGGLDKIWFQDYDGTVRFRVNPSGSYRDPSGWYHLVAVLDTTNATSTERVRIYINGVRLDTFDTNSQPSQNFDTDWSNNVEHRIGADTNPFYFNGHMSQCYFVDGQALDASYFGFTDPLTNTWRPKKFSGEYTFPTRNDGTTWSSLDTWPTAAYNTPPSFAFDNNYDGPVGEYTNWYSSGASTVTLTNLASALGTGVTDVRIWCYNRLGTVTLTVNSQSVATTTSDTYQEISITHDGSAITTFTIQGTDSSYWGIGGIKINGLHLRDGVTELGGTNSFYLPMDGNSPIGEDKTGITTPNDGTFWSAYSSDPYSIRTGGTVEGLFDGNLSGGVVIAKTNTADNEWYVALDGVSIPCSRHVAFYSGNGASTATMRINGNDTYKLAAGNTYINWWHLDFTGTITKIELGYLDGSGSNNTYYGIKVDDHILIDGAKGNSFTPVNFGGSNTIEKATGALPILNTVNGGNVATVGVRTDSNFSALGLALPLVGNVNDVSNQVNNGSTTKTITKGNNVDADTQRYNFYGGSHRFNGSTDYLDVAASSDFAFGTGDFTVECWIYSGVNSLDSLYRRIYMTDGPTGNATGNFQIAITPTSGVINLWETSGQLDVSGTTNVTNQTWNHIAAVRSGTILKLYVNGVEEVSTTYSTSVTANSGSPRPRIGNYNGGSGGGDFDGYMQDLRVYKGVAKYTSNFIPASTNPDILPDTPSGVAGGSALTSIPDSATEGAVVFDDSGDSLQITPGASDTLADSTTYTIEGFLYANSTSGTNYVWAASNKLGIYIYNGTIGWESDFNATYWGGANFRSSISTNKWYHFAAVRNSSDNSCKFFIDGILIHTDTSSSTDTAETVWKIGSNDASQDFGGFISNFRIIKGTALYTSNFTPPTAPLTDVTNTKLLCCQSTTSATAAAVTPGSITANGNAAASKFSPFMPDNINAVRGQESGYCTLNPLEPASASAGTLSDGNLTLTGANYTLQKANYRFGPGHINTGKWYWEIKHFNAASGHSGMYAGLTSQFTEDAGEIYNGQNKTFLSGTYYKNFTATGLTAHGVSYSNGDVHGYALDTEYASDSMSFTYYINGVAITTVTDIPNNVDLAPFIFSTNDGISGAGWGDATINFGQKPFKYAPPEGYKTLCLANLPRPTKAAVRPDKYFKTLLYTGNQTARNITGTSFQPDLVWLKSRAGLVPDSHHALFDSVRGANNAVYSSLTNAEHAFTQTLTSFNSDGFSLGTDADWGGSNWSGTTYVAWCWKAGGAAVSNPDGSITSQVSVNRDAGFSIVTYTGTGANATVGHGLGTTPSFYVVKPRSVVNNWPCWHKDLTNDGYYIHLNLSLKQQLATVVWNNTGPSDTVFNIGTNTNVNQSGATFVAYCWSEVPGFSKIGSWTGNGNADGPYIHCGFRPAFIILKNYAGGSETDWIIEDSARDTYNPVDTILRPNTNQAEATGSSNYYVDFLSNGFKLRTSSAAWNELNSSYIFMAFAEAPTNNLYGGQANAR